MKNKIKKWSKIRKKDKVIVISGSDKGKMGNVEKVNLKKWKLSIPNVAMLKKHKKKTKEQPGSVVSIPGYIDISNVMYYCSTCKQGVRIGILRESGKKIRICKKCFKKLDKI